MTKLASTGGFLRVGNTTMLIGVEEDRLDEALKIVHERCQTKKQMTIANQPLYIYAGRIYSVSHRGNGWWSDSLCPGC